MNCNELANINLSPLSNVININNYFFSGCRKLTTIDLSKLKNSKQLVQCLWQDVLI